MNIEQLLMSMTIILLAARIFGWIFGLIGQPRIVSEMIAGIVLGPSVLGHFSPAAFAYTFPSSILSTLTVVSQVGVLLFMFIVGLKVNLGSILRHGRNVILISNVSIVLPFLLGVGMTRLFYSKFAAPNVPLSHFAVFVGTAMSVTAFPVLAGILQERNMLNTDLGAVAISCAAIDDISAWLLLAVVTGMVHSAQSWLSLATMLLKLLLFLVIMFFPVRLALSWFRNSYRWSAPSIHVFSTAILVMLMSSWITQRIGVHSIFGAFIAGLIMPKEKAFVSGTIARLETLTLVVFLPLFFALTGLRTRIDLLFGTGLLGYALVMIGVAVFGKFAGASITSYALGMPWKNAMVLGILMNTRGLVELVVLNVGFELGILSQSLFTIMVIMALVTTFMTSPILAAMKITGPQAVSDANVDTDAGSGYVLSSRAI